MLGKIVGVIGKATSVEGARQSAGCRETVPSVFVREWLPSRRLDFEEHGLAL